MTVRKGVGPKVIVSILIVVMIAAVMAPQLGKLGSDLGDTSDDADDALDSTGDVGESIPDQDYTGPDGGVDDGGENGGNGPTYDPPSGTVDWSTGSFDLGHGSSNTTTVESSSSCSRVDVTLEFDNSNDKFQLKFTEAPSSSVTEDVNVGTSKSVPGTSSGEYTVTETQPSNPTSQSEAEDGWVEIEFSCGGGSSGPTWSPPSNRITSYGGGEFDLAQGYSNETKIEASGSCERLNVTFTGKNPVGEIEFSFDYPGGFEAGNSYPQNTWIDPDSSVGEIKVVDWHDTSGSQSFEWIEVETRCN